MIRIVVILSAFALCGCSAYSYQHLDYDASGRITARYQITAWRNAMDTSSTSETIQIADGSRLEIKGGSEKPDANVVSAVTTIGQVIVGLGAVVMKFFVF